MSLSIVCDPQRQFRYPGCSLSDCVAGLVHGVVGDAGGVGGREHDVDPMHVAVAGQCFDVWAGGRGGMMVAGLLMDDWPGVVTEVPKGGSLVGDCIAVMMFVRVWAPELVPVDVRAVIGVCQIYVASLSRCGFELFSNCFRTFYAF